MNVRVEITYNVEDIGGVDCIAAVDKSVREKMKKADAVWYGGGYNMSTGDRDMAFDLPVENPSEA